MKFYTAKETCEAIEQDKIINLDKEIITICENVRQNGGQYIEEYMSNPEVITAKLLELGYTVKEDKKVMFFERETIKKTEVPASFLGIKYTKSIYTVISNPIYKTTYTISACCGSSK